MFEYILISVKYCNLRHFSNFLPNFLALFSFFSGHGSERKKSWEAEEVSSIPEASSRVNERSRGARDLAGEPKDPPPEHDPGRGGAGEELQQRPPPCRPRAVPDLLPVQVPPARRPRPARLPAQLLPGVPAGLRTGQGQVQLPALQDGEDM